jgi:hypothetical protein
MVVQVVVQDQMREDLQDQVIHLLLVLHKVTLVVILIQVELLNKQVVVVVQVVVEVVVHQDLL